MRMCDVIREEEKKVKEIEKMTVPFKSVFRLTHNTTKTNTNDSTRGATRHFS